MGQLVDIPGVGQVAFPDGMNDVDITKAIRTQIMPKYGADATNPGSNSMDTSRGAPTDNGPSLGPFPKDEAAGYAATRIRNAATGLLGMPRAFNDLVRYGGSKMGLSPADMQNVLRATPLTTQAAPLMPSSQDLNNATEVATGFKPVNGNPIVDAGMEAALAGPMVGGGVGSIVPSAAGGVTSEMAGRATAGTPYEPFARLAGAFAGAKGGAMAQTGVQKGVNVVKNVLPNVDEATGRIIAKNALRDKTTVEALEANRPEGGMLVEAGGPNVQGALRGSVAGQGEGRTNALENVTKRVEGSDKRTVNALNKGISPDDSLASTIEALSAERAAAAAPAYQAAGVPARPERLPQFAINEPNPGFNTRNIDSPAVSDLLNNSSDIQQAIATARKLPDYRDLPPNSMSMLDKAYKHVGGMEQESVRAGNGARAHDLGNLRGDFKTALVDANPEYGRALKAYSGPSSVIDAAETGRDWFKKNVDPGVVSREFQMLSPDQQQAALIGVRDWARTNIGSPGPSLAANKVKLSGDNLARMEAILPPDAFKTLVTELGVERNLGATMNRTGLNAGSRTTPMMLEAADNAGMAGGVVGDLAHGRPVSAIGRLAGNALSRLTEGRTEAVNARIADLLTSTDPAKVGLVRSLAARAELERQLTQQGRSSALGYGMSVAPMNALNYGQRQ